MGDNSSLKKKRWEYHIPAIKSRFRLNYAEKQFVHRKNPLASLTNFRTWRM